MSNNHSDFDPYAPDDDFRFDEPVQPPFDWQPAPVQTQQSDPPVWNPADEPEPPEADTPIYTYSPNQAEGQPFEDAVATPVRPAESMRRPQIPPRPDFEGPAAHAPAAAAPASAAAGAVKRVLDDLIDVIRPLFRNDPLDAAKKAGQKGQLFVWVVILVLTVVLGVFRHTNVYLRALLNGSLWMLYIHNFLSILLTCALPVGLAFMLKAAHKVRLKPHHLLNMVAASLLPVLFVSFLNLLLGFIGSAAMLRFLINPLASAAWLMHYLLFRRALQAEKAGQTPAFEWMMLGYALIRFMAVAGFAA